VGRGQNSADASQPKNLRKFCENYSKDMGLPGSLPAALEANSDLTTCSQTWLELLIDCPFLLG
jgi:hypothetical protein